MKKQAFYSSAGAMGDFHIDEFTDFVIFFWENNGNTLRIAPRPILI